MTTKQYLFDHESSRAELVPVTTLNFFTGPMDEGVKYLKSRWAEVAKLNPWIGATMGRDPDGRVFMEFGSQAVEVENSMDELVVVDHTLEIHDKMDVSSMKLAFEKTKAGLGLLSFMLQRDKDTGRLPLVSRMTVAPNLCNPQNSFVVVFALSHNVGDGYTYYKLLSMLSPKVPIEALSPVRKEGFTEQVRKSYSYPEATDFKVNCALGFLKAKLLGIKAKWHCYCVDSEKVAKAKAKSNAEGLVPFISTNDLLLSHFGEATQADLILSLMNVRGRVGNAVHTDAGNYFIVLGLNSHSLKTPDSLRAFTTTGPPFTNQTTHFGAFGTAFLLKSGIMTSWVFDCFDPGDMKFESCKLDFHMPYMYSRSYAGNMATVFRPFHGELAVMYMSMDLTPEQLKGENSPLGDVFAPDIFM